jgi:hypothetical protein
MQRPRNCQRDLLASPYSRIRRSTIDSAGSRLRGLEASRANPFTFEPAGRKGRAPGLARAERGSDPGIARCPEGTFFESEGVPSRLVLPGGGSGDGRKIMPEARPCWQGRLSELLGSRRVDLRKPAEHSRHFQDEVLRSAEVSVCPRMTTSGSLL